MSRCCQHSLWRNTDRTTSMDIITPSSQPKGVQWRDNPSGPDRRVDPDKEYAKFRSECVGKTIIVKS